MADVERLLGGNRRAPEGEIAAPVDKEEWLAFLDVQRQALIMQLRAVERVLVREGRLRSYSLPQRLKD